MPKIMMELLEDEIDKIEDKNCGSLDKVKQFSIIFEKSFDSKYKFRSIVIMLAGILGGIGAAACGVGFFIGLPISLIISLATLNLTPLLICLLFISGTVGLGIISGLSYRLAHVGVKLDEVLPEKVLVEIDKFCNEHPEVNSNQLFNCHMSAHDFIEWVEQATYILRKPHCVDCGRSDCRCNNNSNVNASSVSVIVNINDNQNKTKKSVEISKGEDSNEFSKKFVLIRNKDKYAGSIFSNNNNSTIDLCSQKPTEQIKKLTRCG